MSIYMITSYKIQAIFNLAKYNILAIKGKQILDSFTFRIIGLKRGQFAIPTGLCSDRSMFRQVYVPTGLYSDRSIFRQSIIRHVVIPTGPWGRPLLRINRFILYQSSLQQN